MKDIRSLLLALLSFGLVATWIYHFYDKSNYSRERVEAPVIDSTVIINRVRDSLEKTYSAAIKKMDIQLDSSYATSDSLYSRLSSTEAELDNKVQEANRLRTEINQLLQKPSITTSELTTARQKINELEEIVQQLRSEKGSLEAEKKELIAKLDQMGGEVSGLQQSIHRMSDENKNLADKVKQSSVFVATALHFTAMHTKSEKEQETSQAKRADKFVGSFILQNNFNDLMNAEIMIVITEPGEHILQNSAWDSGTFDTKSGGRKSYTRKMKFDYAKGEQKALIFSLDVDAPQKGVYTLQIWHNGVLIGEITKTLG